MDVKNQIKQKQKIVFQISLKHEEACFIILNAYDLLGKSPEIDDWWIPVSEERYSEARMVHSCTINLVIWTLCSHGACHNWTSVQALLEHCP